MTTMRASSRHTFLAATVLAAALAGLGYRSAADASPASPASPPPAQAPLWAASYAPGGLPAAVAANATTAFVTGSSAGSGTGLDYTTVAYNAATGAMRWAARYNGPANGDDRAYAVAASRDGSAVFVTGRSTGVRSGWDYATVGYNAVTGARLRAARYNGPADGTDIAHSVAVSPDSSEVFVTGVSAGKGSGSDYVTIAYDAATGAQLWLRRYSSPGARTDSATSLAVNPDGGEVYVTGSSASGGSGSDYVTIAYDVGSGTQLWLARYAGPAHGRNDARQVAVSRSGRAVVVTGTSEGVNSGQDYATVAYAAATGARVWARRYHGQANGADVAVSLAFSEGGKVFVTGTSAGVGTGLDYATIAYTIAHGQTFWTSRYTTQGDHNDLAAGVAEDFPGGETYVTGTGDGGKLGLVTVAYDTNNGTESWVGDYSPGGAATAVAIANDKDQVFVLGHADHGPGFVTIAYPALP
jgi:WD40 repeat protein